MLDLNFGNCIKHRAILRIILSFLILEVDHCNIISFINIAFECNMKGYLLVRHDGSITSEADPIERVHLADPIERVHLADPIERVHLDSFIRRGVRRGSWERTEQLNKVSGSLSYFLEDLS